MKKVTLLVSVILFSLFTNAQCNEPTNVVLHNDDSYYYNALYLLWDANAASIWDIEYGEQGFIPSGLPIVDDHTNNSFNVNDINIETSVYVDFYVRADCGATTSDWVGPLTFYNYCIEMYYGVEEFFDDEFIPNCWIESNEGSPDIGIGVLGESIWESSAFANDSSNSLGAKININETDVNEWLILPLMRGVQGVKYDEYPLVLDFDIALTESNSTNAATLGIDDSIQLVISTDLGESWNSIQIWDSNSNISNVGENVYIEYWHNGNLFELFWKYFLVGFYISSGSTNDANVDFFIDYLTAWPPSTGSVSDLKSKGFSFYPNPSENTIKLSAKEPINQVVIYNSLGQKLKEIPINALNKQITISDLPNGIYFMQVTIGNTRGIVSVVKN